MTTIGVAWRTARAARISKPRKSVTIQAAVWLARKLPTWNRVRSAVMQTGACAAIDVGLFEASTIAGWIGVGISLFVLETLSGEK